MKRRFSFWLLLGCLAGAGGLAAAPAGRTPHIDDTVQLLPPIPGDQDALEAKLADFEQATGIKILVEFREHAPGAEEDKVPGAYMSRLAGQLGTLKHGVLVVYFGEDTDWRVWIGDELIPQFTGKPGTVKQLTANGTIHDVKDALLTAAHEKAEAGYVALQKSLPGDELPSADQKVRLQLGALLDALIAKLGPK
jgi:hypothetical protein